MRNGTDGGRCGFLLATILACACAPDETTHPTPPAGSALVVTTDYETGAYAAIDPATRTAIRDIDVIHKDAVCREDPLTGQTFIVSRLGADAVELVDTAGSWDVAAEYSVGTATNPQDIAIVSEHRAYVARYAEPSLLVVDPLTGAQLGTVDLSAYADADGSPEAAWMLVHGSQLFVALQKLVDFDVAGASAMLVLDGATGVVQREIPLAGANMYGKLRYAGAIDRIPLVIVGRFGALDGGIQLIDPADGSISPFVVTEQALGGDLSDAVIASATRGYAVIGVSGTDGASTRLVEFDPSTGEVGATLIASEGWELGFVELDPTGAELWVADRNPARPGVRIFDAATGAELTAQPIDTGLPPFMICFPRTASTGDAAALADVVTEAPGDTGSGLGDARHAIDGVHGAGSAQGNTDDVFSLGYGAGADDHVVLSWSGRNVTNGPGADFAVFENAFLVGGGPEAFMDPAVVYVSRDGALWVPFPHDYLAADETAYSALPSDWSGFAGVTPVLLNDDTNPVDPLDAATAGGDRFDLDALSDIGEEGAIKADGFRYLKLVSAAVETNSDTGAPFVHDDISNGPDIDGAYARYLR
jgi:hypothetical protein